jgi:hypothetical protein
MRTKLISVGQRKWIPIPVSILREAGLRDVVHLSVIGGKLVISSKPAKSRPRSGWAKAISAEIRRSGVPENLWGD